MQTLKREINKRKKRGVSQIEHKAYEKLFDHLNEGKAARDLVISREELNIYEDLHLLTLKPVVY